MAVTHITAITFALGCLAASHAARAADPAAARFVEAAYASAQFQDRISKAAQGRDLRPEAKALTQEVGAYRDRQIPALVNLAKGAGVPVRDALDRELRSVAENLEPLNGLELSRRYAEAEAQALDKEVGVYDEAARSGPDSVKTFAGRELPELQRLRDLARSAFDNVKP